MARYYGYANLVLTDYLEFRFYRNGLPYQAPISIASFDLKHRTITPHPQNYGLVAQTLIDFAQGHKEPIRSGEHLAKIMGGKAQRIRDNIKQYFSADKNSEISRIYEIVTKLLVHDLSIDAFADMYAQTLTYGLFVARYHDKTPDTFSRQEARELIPASNPFLRHFFDHIVGPNFDKRLEYIVNELCEVFLHADVQELMKQYYQKDLWGETHESPDPVIHFYEDFLKEYDPELRKKMGAFYTPVPVVRFIVRSVDYLLKKEFNLAAGLADTSKTADGTHRVQILDPAVGTGTFISATIRSIYKHLIDSGQKGRWPGYVHHDLLPRLHGFELMMTPYTIAHLKLSMAFKETGFSIFNNRLGIYLTNSLETESEQAAMPFLFGLAESIAEESKAAEKIKNKTPIMVVLGNPPYSVSSSNKSKWILELLEVYKKELNEKNIQPLSDDYIKFIRLAEHFVEKSKSGIVAMITNNSFIDGIIHRQMRKHLLETFDDIYIIDLHGNSKKKEQAQDGGKDDNVFDIQQGVAISIFVKRGSAATPPSLAGICAELSENAPDFPPPFQGEGRGGDGVDCMISASDQKQPHPHPNLPLEGEGTKALAQGGRGCFANLYHHELYGKRDAKFQALNESDLQSIKWNKLDCTAPYYFFVPKDFGADVEYKHGFSVDELFIVYSDGIVTARDSVTIKISPDELWSTIEDFSKTDSDVLRTKHKIGKDSPDWSIGQAKTDLLSTPLDKNRIIPITYRPFDFRFTYFTGKSSGFHSRPRNTVMQHAASRTNIAIITTRQITNLNFCHIFCTKNIVEKKSGSHDRATTFFPLYLYAEDNTRTPNLNKEIVAEIENIVGETTPEDIFDYIYATLHSPHYREKYKEFLKIDFPRVPYPHDKESFKALVSLGAELRLLHLMESPKLGHYITTYPEAGSDTVENITYKNERVIINSEQYFGNVPELAWNFYIGGYQPAQKWLKDRKGRTLTNDDIDHYQKMVVALVETNRIMGEIDLVI